MLWVWSLLATAASSTPLPFNEPGSSAHSPVVYGEPVYVLVLYILSIGFVFASAIVHNGLGLKDNGSCQASMRICITFYASTKVTM
ncbi:hypothetical protein CFE70_001697 [Pyrenophora teres f. teres 0-1]